MRHETRPEVRHEACEYFAAQRKQTATQRKLSAEVNRKRVEEFRSEYLTMTQAMRDDVRKDLHLAKEARDALEHTKKLEARAVRAQLGVVREQKARGAEERRQEVPKVQSNAGHLDCFLFCFVPR